MALQETRRSALFFGGVLREKIAGGSRSPIPMVRRMAGFPGADWPKGLVLRMEDQINMDNLGVPPFVETTSEIRGDMVRY